MENVILRFVFDKKNETEKDPKSTGLLQIEIRRRGSSDMVHVTTDIRILKEQYYDKKGTTKIVKHPKANALTISAQNLFSNLKNFCSSEKCKSLKDVKKWRDENHNTDSFINFVKEELATRSRIEDLSLNTIKQHNVILRKLESYGKLTKFSDLTASNMEKFEYWLKEQGVSDVTAHKNQSILKIYVRRAKSKDLIDKDPYEKFTPRRGKSKDPVFLDESEVMQLQKCDLTKYVEGTKLIRARDLFVFQCFTGLAYIDLMNFSKEDISVIDGYEVFRSSRQKTNESFISALLPEAKAILEEYKYELPRISNQKYNDYIKLVAGHAKVNKILTTHVARHTFATYLLNRGVSIDIVARTLGHSDTKMTEHYAKLLGKTVVDSMASVFNIVRLTKPTTDEESL